MYTVFVRDWWKDNPKRPGQLEPYPDAPIHNLKKGIKTEQEAREMAQEYNRNHTPGRFSRKAEFTET